MTCDEFERVLPELEGEHNLEQVEHLKVCSTCADLVSDLNSIAEQARVLPDQEPGPRVWNAIELALKQEGLIRESQPQLQLVPPIARSPRWKFPWMVPVAAALIVGSALLFMHHQVSTVARQQQTSPAVVATALQSSQASVMSPEEDQLLRVIAERAPAMRERYESDMRAVDAYIQDAELSARNNPNDEIAQQYLMNAYEQRAMVYEMAMNRTLQ